ncbi:MAG: hypothetical protein KGI54_17165, partial [Pseudomonadota bacterium]|nr:hypothetical protein [Pseudomonadota bacterium]
SVSSLSLKNAVNLMDANFDINQIYTAYTILSEALAAPVSLDPTTLAYLTDRLNGLLSFSSNLTRFQLTLPDVNTTLSSGQVSIPDPKYLEYVLDFAGEAIPTGLTDSNFISMATAAAGAWNTLAGLLIQSGFGQIGAQYQMCINMYNASMAVVQNLSNASFTANYALLDLWNMVVAVPAYLTLSALIGNDPTSVINQNFNTAKYAIYQNLNGMNQLLVALREQISGNIQTVQILEGDTLMSIAARALGNFELWQQIAMVNSLLPPYISSDITIPNTAAPGQYIFLPTGATIQAGTAVPSYTTNYLGVDIYYGPIGQNMLTWTGDFNTISGYNNLAMALGRRLQTPLGALIYHENFGSRLPFMVGSIMTANDLQVAQEYTKSSLLSDPRSATVLTSSAQYNNYAIAVQANVTPNGFSGNSVNVNEVIR